jgi:hypothetical protein
LRITWIKAHEKDRFGTGLFTAAGVLYVGSPFLEAFHVIPAAPDSPPLAAIALASSASALPWDTVLDAAIEIPTVAGVTVRST